MFEKLEEKIRSGLSKAALVGIVGLTNLSGCFVTHYRPEAFEPRTHGSRTPTSESSSKREAMHTLKKFFKKACDQGFEVTPDYFICRWMDHDPRHNVNFENKLEMHYLDITGIKTICFAGCSLHIYNKTNKDGFGNPAPFDFPGCSGREECQEVINAIYSLRK